MGLHFHTFCCIWCLGLLQIFRYDNARKCDISNEIMHECEVREGLGLQNGQGVC